MRQRSGGRMKRPRLDGASSRRRSTNASGSQSTSRITPGTVRVEIDRQGLELLRNQSKSRLCGVSAIATDTLILLGQVLDVVRVANLSSSPVNLGCLGLHHA